MKRRYKVRVQVADGVEETQFTPTADSTPRIRTRYVRDPSGHGKYRDGAEYSIDPERPDEAEEVLASDDPAVIEQRKQEKAAERSAKKGNK